MIDEKYTAGFVDADGSISIHPIKLVDGTYRIHSKVSVGQLEKNNITLLDIAREFDVELHDRVQPNGAAFQQVELTGNKAVLLLNRIKKHLVIKDELANYVANLNGTTVDKETLAAIKRVVKLLRKKDQPSKNHPSRKWMAGYVDGDGCFYARTSRKGVLNAKLIIASSADALAGCNLIKKAFGGSLRSVGNTAHLEIYLSSTKAKELYDYFGQHLRNKKTQALLVKDFVGGSKHSLARGATKQTNDEFCKVLATTKSIGISETK